MASPTAASARLLCMCVAVSAGPALAQAPACAGMPGGPRIEVIVSGVRADQGLMTATLYPAAAGRFLKPKGEISLLRVPARAPQTELCFAAPGPGRYAIAVYDDLNGNLKFDHTAFAPLEPYGFSNNPRILLALPSAQAAAFPVGGAGAAVTIRLRYPPGAR